MGALEEYLNDPNFEQNRIEYKANKDSADKGIKNGRANPKKVEKGEFQQVVETKFSFISTRSRIIYINGSRSGLGRFFF